jgi:adenine phosphoribosyltransferase
MNPKEIYMNFIVEIRDEGLHGRDLFDGIVDVTTLMIV